MVGEVEVTDEITRAALNVLANKVGGCPGLTLHDVCDDTQCGCAEIMRAALTAVAPMIARATYERGQADMREKAAKVADEDMRRHEAAADRAKLSQYILAHDSRADVAEKIAAAIRALPTGGENGT